MRFTLKQVLKYKNKRFLFHSKIEMRKKRIHNE